MLNKSETIKNLNREVNFSLKKTEQVYNSIVEQMTDYLSKDIGFTIPEFGSFRSEVRDEYESFNPHYEKRMRYPIKKVVHFSQSSSIKEDINKVEL